MEDLYHKYYLTQDCVNNLVSTAMIVFDTSALLDLYYYSDSTRQTIISDVFAKLNGRLWIPAQVAFEFQKNKAKVSHKPVDTYKVLISTDMKSDGAHVKKISDLSEKLGATEIRSIDNQIKTLKEKTAKKDKHPFLQPEIFDDYDMAIEKIKACVKEFQEATAAFSTKVVNAVNCRIDEIENNHSDPVQEALDSHFQVGAELFYDEMLKIAKDGSMRYMEKMGPGYMDESEKKGLQKYGDLYVWKGIINEATRRQKDVLFVTNDVKEDWWDEELTAPRFELLKEFNSFTGKNFWSCKMKDFLYLYNEAFTNQLKTPDETIKEVELVEQRHYYKASTEIDEYKDIINRWLAKESGNIRIEESVPIPAECRVFGKLNLYHGIGDGTEYRVLINMINNPGHAKLLHAVQNLHEIKAFFDEKEGAYKYVQFTILSSEESCHLAIELLEKKNIRRYFYRKNIIQYIGFIQDDNFIYMDSNVAVG